MWITSFKSSMIFFRSDGIAESVSFNREERLLRVRVKGCLHRPVEDRMVAQGIELAPVCRQT